MRGRARQLELLAGVDDLGAVHLEDGHVAVRIVADIEVLAVGAEHHALREAAYLDLAHLRHFFVVDLEYGQAAVSLDVEPHALRHARPTQEHGHRDVAPRADRKDLGRVPHHHAIDDLRRVVTEFDYYVCVDGALA